MYLEKLEIQGFKSFANKNKLIFPGALNKDGQHGLTAIVGPNGSGKSNIADAIRWVLGEQSLKTLRGKKSEDVIFSGSDKKSQLGMAEVSLYLNNEHKNNLEKNISDTSEENTLDANGNSLSPLNYDQIVITRRLFRNGDSEYLLNGNRVRLSDIQILLARSNVGQKTYSVIGQGMVENFLNTGANERKEFFDEATGVKQFQIKRDQALNKLESSYANLQQVEMLLGEIKPRLKILTRQVDKLAKRGQIEEELKVLQLTYYSKLWHEIVTKINESQSKLKELNQEKNVYIEQLNDTQKELDLIKNTDTNEDNKRLNLIQELQQKKNNIIKDIARLNAEIELQFEIQGNFDAAWLNKRLEELKTEKQQLNQEISNLENNNFEDKIQQTKLILTKLQEDINEKNKIQQNAESLKLEKDKLQKQIDRLDAFLETSLENQGHYDLSWLNNKKTDIEKISDTLEKEINAINLTSLENSLKDLAEKKNKINNTLQLKNLELQKINQELRNSSKTNASREEINHSIDAFLEKLDKIKKESDPIKIKAIITEAKLEFKQQITKLIDGEISEKLEKVKNLQAEIIKNSEKAQDFSNEINKQQLELSTRKEKRNLLQNRLKELTTEKLDIEEKIKKGQSLRDVDTIKKEKEEIEEKILITISKIQELEQMANKELLFNEIETTKEKLNSYQLQITAQNDKITYYQERLRANEKEFLSTQDKIIKGEKALNVEEIKLSKLSLEKQLEPIEQQLLVWQEEVRIETLNRQKEKDRFFLYQEKIQTLNNKINHISNALNAVQIEVARQETRQEDLSNNIIEDELNIIDIKNYTNNELGKNNENDLRNKINHLKNQLEQIGGIEPETEKEFHETNERYLFLDKQTKDLNAAINSLEKIIFELDANIKERFEKEFKLIAEKFSEYFKILFNGGQAKIFKLEAEEEDSNKNEASVEDEKSLRLKKLKKYNSLRISGIEIQATPPGKKIQSISMLSGGERALTAIALICAIISSNPSPFVVLDEVDAALDEANSERLAQILEDLSTKTQFISITHNRASMKKSSIIYGITMKADGVSQLLSIRLDDIAAFKD